MTTDPDYDLAELNKETGLGGYGEEIAREIPQIDMSDYFNRQEEIAEALWVAATGIGFFQLTNHGIPQALIDEAFDRSAAFFDMPAESKARFPLKPGTNAGWEYMAQVRPSTGTADRKESYQITLPRMAELWPDGSELFGFKETMLAFERHNWALAMKVLNCFAGRLGFPAGFFTEGHNPDTPQYQSTLRLLHYLWDGGKERPFNLGTGTGYSVQQVVDAAQRITGEDIRVKDGFRREGDPAILIADGSKARKALGWRPKYSDLDTIIQHAWRWENRVR